jgi:TolB-like protein
VKHGTRVHLFNLFGEGVGNPRLPRKLQAFRQRRRVRWAASVGLLLLALLAGAFFFLRKPTLPVVAAPEKSVAVLPFENLSREPDNAFFAEGVQDEILTDLAKVSDLKVISRTSVMQYKSGLARNLREIGQQLGVAHLLEGSVQRANNKVRVNAQLINARTDAHEWAENYDRPLDDVFGIQSEIAKVSPTNYEARSRRRS